MGLYCSTSSGDSWMTLRVQSAITAINLEPKPAAFLHQAQAVAGMLGLEYLAGVASVPPEARETATPMELGKSLFTRQSISHGAFTSNSGVSVLRLPENSRTSSLALASMQKARARMRPNTEK